MTIRSDRHGGKLVAPSRALDHHLGRCLRQRRLRLGLSQRDIAEFLGVTYQQVQKYEHGSNRIAADTLMALAEFLDLPIDAFFAQDAPAPVGRDPREEPPPDGFVRRFVRLRPWQQDVVGQMVCGLAGSSRTESSGPGATWRGGPSSPAS